MTALRAPNSRVERTANFPRISCANEGQARIAAGGRIDRGAPCYGEDNEYVYGELLGMSSREIAALADEGVI